MHLLRLSIDELASLMHEYGQPPFRAKQIYHWLHQTRVDSIDQMTNLPKALRERFAIEAPVHVLSPLDHQASEDSLTEKWLWEAADGARMESVLIRDLHQKRRTVCVSCMDGCPVGCTFCATGQLGFQRNLTKGEILEQIYRIDQHLTSRREEGVSHVVFMGMGEPLLNYDQSVSAALQLCDKGGMGLSRRHVTLSTVGVTPGIARLIEDQVPVRLAISLHAAEQALRDRLIPHASRWPLRELMQLTQEFALTQPKGVTFEYCLLHKVNDRPKHAQALIKLIRDIRCRVNLIPYNASPEADFLPPPDSIRSFQRKLVNAGVRVTLRHEKGAGIDAACGQLRAKRHKT